MSIFTIPAPTATPVWREERPTAVGVMRYRQVTWPPRAACRSTGPTTLTVIADAA